MFLSSVAPQAMDCLESCRALPMAQTLWASPLKKSPQKKRRLQLAGITISHLINLLRSMGFYSRTINADAFADATRENVINIIKQEMDKIDLVVYSLASLCDNIQRMDAIVKYKTDGKCSSDKDGACRKRRGQRNNFGTSN